MISVAMTTYNGQKYVKKQIESILNQELAIDELIICDDNSSDETVNIIKSIPDERIKLYVNETNLGYVKNFRKSISLTKGNLIFLADQDDIWEQNKTRVLTDVMKQEKCQAVCSNFNLIDSEDKGIENKSEYGINKFVLKAKKRLKRISFHKLIYGNLLQGCTYCFSEEVKRVFLETDNDEVIHDYQIMLVAANMGKVLFVNEPLISYRLHTGNSIGFKKVEKKWEVEKKKPSKKPFMVLLLEDINKVSRIRFIWYYKLIYYLRIPYLISIIKRGIIGA